jgi:C-terminal peptidase prc
MLSSLVLALTPLLFAPAAQDTADIDVMLRERAQAAAGASLQEVWASSHAIRDAVGDEGEARLAAAIDALLDSEASLPERAVLLFAATRLQGADPDVGKLAARLTSLLDSSDSEVALGAAGLSADRAFHALKDEAREELATKLTAAMRDGNRTPELRLACAAALHAQGRGNLQREARKEMMDFLASSDARLRGLGALALARVGDLETARAELERLASVPDEFGILAASYLKQEEIRRVYGRREKNLLDYTKKQVEGTELKGNHDLALMENVMRLIETTSLEGDKVKREELVNAALDGMLHSLDEHSSYMPPKIFKDFDQDLLQAGYGGIGAYVGEDPEDKLFTIRQPIYSGPAYRAGLHSEDKIVRIDDWPTFDSRGCKPVDEIIKRLKGKPGTQVKLYIWRRGLDPALIERPTEDLAVSVTREEVTIPPLKADLLPGGIAHIELASFTRVASEQLANTIEEYKKQGMKAVVLDLRQNSGGLLTEARNVANIFLPKRKLVVTTESRTDDPHKEFTQGDPLIPADMPVVVLISRYSASASEIVAGALQDYQRATIVGQRSYGKGSVQQLLPIPGEKDDSFKDENGNGRHDSWEPLTKDWNDNGEFDYAPRARLTIARYLLPSGRSIHREINEKGEIENEGGVEPEMRIDPKRYEAWRIEEMNRIYRSRKIRDYLDEHYSAQKELFLKLAVTDNGDTSLYPNFDQLYQSLETTLNQQDVRLLVRREVRGRAQDDRGSAFPEQGDFQEDPQLQGAIRTALEKLGTSVDDIEGYARTFDPIEKLKDSKLLAANLSDSKRSDLRHALSLIIEGKSGGGLSAERLAELEKTLQSVLDQ